MKVEDRRANKEAPWAYVVCTDDFMSGWGGASGGRSLYAVAVSDPAEAEVVMANAKGRSEMKRPRLVSRFKADGTPKVTMRRGDHMAVVDKATAERWYEPGAWEVSP